MVGVDVANRNADDDDRYTAVGGVDRAAVGAAAGTNRFLNRNAKLASQLKREALEARIGDHRTVEVAQHRAFLHRGLDEVVRGEGVVRRAALKADGDVRFDNVAGDKGAALADLLLGGQNADHVNVQIAALQVLHGFQNCRTADAVVEGLAQHDVGFFIVLEGDIRDNRRADVDVEYLLNLFLGGGADVDDHVGDGRAGVFLRRGQEVNRSAGNDAGYPLAVIGLHLYLVGRNGVVGPAAQRKEVQGAVWLDGLYDEADLIAVRIHHDNRFFAGVFVRVDVDVQVAVVSDCAQILVVSVLFSDGNNLVLKAACAVCVGQSFDQF